MEPIYIFVSHSHKDLEKVRVIRNYLELLNGEPILFFLKSLNDVDQITKLIKDEIDARIWFIYCKSKNAEQSEWVKSELEYVKLTHKENQLIIDLDVDVTDNLTLTSEGKYKIDRMFNVVNKLHDLFICCSMSDKNEYRLICESALNIGINVFMYENMLASDLWAASIKDNISSSKIILFLFSNKSIMSKAFLAEVNASKKLNKEIFVVLDKEVESNPTFILLLGDRCFFRFDRNDPKTSIAKLMQKLYKHLIR